LNRRFPDFQETTGAGYSALFKIQIKSKFNICTGLLQKLYIDDDWSVNSVLLAGQAPNMVLELEN